MHVPRIETRTLDETVEALDLGQTPADIVFLSFSDSDLNALARAYDAFPEPKPSLRIASLAALRHPFSVDLYLEKVCARARLVVARVLGGADYWRYGVDELRALTGRSDVKLALLPGDRRRDARLDEASTLDSDAVGCIWRYFDEGGPDNMTACLGFFASAIGGAAIAPPPAPVSAFGRFDGACCEAGPEAAHALIVFYRSIYLANDLEPVEALALALGDKGFAVTSVFVTSLKDEAALSSLRSFLKERRFDVVLNATAFSARLDESEGTALDALDAPIMQVVLAGTSLDAWRASQRGLGPSDLAMHVALPEIDGRILSRAISFKAASARDAQTEFAAVAHRPLADRVDFVAELARRWASLRRTAPSDKAPRLRAAGLSRARRPHRLCSRSRYAGERRCDLRDPARRGLRGDRRSGCAVAHHHPRGRAARGDADACRIRGRACHDPAGLPAILVRRMGRAVARPRLDRRSIPAPLHRGSASLSSPFSLIGAMRSRARATITISICRPATPMSRSISGSPATRKSTRSFSSARTARSNGCRARLSRSAKVARPKSCSDRPRSSIRSLSTIPAKPRRPSDASARSRSAISRRP